MGGWAGREVRFPDERTKVDTRDGFVWIRRGDIASYFDETFVTAVTQYNRWKRFGLPHGGGWIHERESYVQVLEIVDEGVTLFQSREMERRKDDSRGIKGRHKS